MGQWIYKSMFSDLGSSCCFTPGERAPGTHWMGGAPDDVENILDPTRDSDSVLQPVASRYTYFAIPAL
jgi:hypothetical protein